MFVTAIDRAARFTRAIHFISRVWKSEQVIPGTATLFFVNSDGWALTCKHVVNELVASEHLNKQYDSFKAERSALVADSTKEQSIKELQTKYGFTESSFIESQSSFVDCVDKFSDVEFKTHPSAALRFSISVTSISSFATHSQSSLKTTILLAPANLSAV